MVGAERVEGSWRPVFIHNVTYYVTDLLVYADGMVDCWGLITQEQFRGKVESGWVTTTVPPGEPVSVHALAAWTMPEATSLVTSDELVAEVDTSRAEPLTGVPPRMYLTWSTHEAGPRMRASWSFGSTIPVTASWAATRIVRCGTPASGRLPAVRSRAMSRAVRLRHVRLRDAHER